MSSDLSSNPSLGKEPESDIHRETFLYPITGWLEATSKGVSPSTSLGRFCPAEIRDELYRRHEVFTSKIGYGPVNTADSSALKEMRALWKRPRTRSRAVGLWQAKITSAASEAFTFETPSWLVRPEVLQRDQFTSRDKKPPSGCVPLRPHTFRIYTWVQPADPSSTESVITTEARMLHIPAPQEFRAAFSESLRGSVRKIRESDDYDTWLNANISDVSLVETDWQSRVTQEAKSVWRTLDGQYDVEIVPCSRAQYERDNVPYAIGEAIADLVEMSL
ncbi:hypothetical protein EHS25_002875 [Saitozyma podzolica]|uniref:Uncharacterized protein n=1 Tax=Saitozyma podzolica TaxID=1890683 RepID=A0A427YC34_9TREE|nr:hypothetical protein EHS25_002875 [Saitozyma podzolica]